MPETQEPVQREHRTPGPVTPHIRRVRRHKRKRRLSARRKQVRVFGVLSVIVLCALFLAFLWWLNQP